MGLTWQITRGFILSIFITSRVWSSPIFLQEHVAELSDEDEDEDTEDVYDEEEIVSVSTTKPTREKVIVVSKGAELVDDEEEDAVVKVVLGQGLGNSSTNSISEKISQIGKISYSIESVPKRSAAHFKKGVKPPPVPIKSTATKYHISKKRTKTTSPSPFGTTEKDINQTDMGNLVIKLPNGMMGSGADTFEINIPLKMLLSSNDASASSSSIKILDPYNKTSQMYNPSNADLSLKSIETALLEALFRAQGINLPTSLSTNNVTETIEFVSSTGSSSSVPTTEKDNGLNLDGVTVATSELYDSFSSTLTSLSSTHASPQQEDGLLLLSTTPQSIPTTTIPLELLSSKPTRRRRLRSTTTPETIPTAAVPLESPNSEPIRRRRVRSTTTPEVPTSKPIPILIPSDPAGMGQVANIIMTQIRNGIQNPEVSIVSFVKNTVRVVQRLECVFFDYCDDL